MVKPDPDIFSQTEYMRVFVFDDFHFRFPHSILGEGFDIRQHRIVSVGPAPFHHGRNLALVFEILGGRFRVKSL
jgi:hypothetical protein